MIAEKDTGDVLILYVMNSTFYKLKRRTHIHTRKKETEKNTSLLLLLSNISSQFLSRLIRHLIPGGLNEITRLDFQSTPSPEKLNFVQPRSSTSTYTLFITKGGMSSRTDKIGRKRSWIEVPVSVPWTQLSRRVVESFFFFSSGPPDKRPPKLQVATLEPSLEGGGGRERGEMVEAPSKLERTVNNATLR